MADPTQIPRSEYYKQKVKLIGIMNKKANSMYKACDVVTKRLAEVAGSVDTIIMNEKINAYLRLVVPENTDDYLAGHLPYDFKNALDRRDAVHTFEEYIVCVQRPLNVSEKRPVDLFETRMEVASHHVVYDKKRNRDGIYKSDYITIRVADNDNSRLAYITINDCINNCLLGKDDGTVTDGEPTDSSPLSRYRTLMDEIGTRANGPCADYKEQNKEQNKEQKRVYDIPSPTLQHVC